METATAKHPDTKDKIFKTITSAKPHLDQTAS
jgi:hypothetical protein